MNFCKKKNIDIENTVFISINDLWKNKKNWTEKNAELEDIYYYQKDLAIICIPKNYFNSFFIDLDNIKMDIQEIENNQVVVSACCDTIQVFNNNYLKNIKCFIYNKEKED